MRLGSKQTLQETEKEADHAGWEETPVVEERKSEPVLPKSPFQGIPKPRWLDESEEEEQTPEDAFSPIPPQNCLQKVSSPD